MEKNMVFNQYLLLSIFLIYIVSMVTYRSVLAIRLDWFLLGIVGLYLGIAFYLKKKNKRQLFQTSVQKIDFLLGCLLPLVAFLVEIWVFIQH